MKIKNSLSHILSFFAALSVGVIFFLFARKHLVPSGVDGYYYLKQIRYFGETFAFYFQDFSVAYIPVFALQLILKNDLLVYQIATSAVCALTLWAHFLLARLFLPKDIKKPLLVALFCIGFCVFSLNVYEIARSFYKNAFAVMAFSYALYFAVSALTNKTKRWQRLLALGFLALSVASHKSAVLWFACFVLAYLSVYGKSKALKLSPQRLVSAALGLFIAIGVFSVIFPNSAGLLKAAGESLKLSYEYPVWLFKLGSFRDFMVLSYLIQLLVVVGLIIQLRLEKSQPLRFAMLFYVFLFGLTVLPIYVIGEGEFGYRLLLGTSCLIGPALVLLLNGRRLPFSVPEFSVAILIFQFVYTSPLEQNFENNNDMDEGLQKLSQLITPDDYVFTYHGLEFFIDYKTNIRVRIFLPDEEVKGQVYRIVHVPYGNLKWIEVKREVYKLSPLQINKTHFLIKESDWQDILKKFEVPENFRNKTLVNPGHVHK